MHTHTQTEGGGRDREMEKGMTKENLIHKKSLNTYRYIDGWI